MEGISKLLNFPIDKIVWVKNVIDYFKNENDKLLSTKLSDFSVTDIAN